MQVNLGSKKGYDGPISGKWTLEELRELAEQYKETQWDYWRNASSYVCFYDNYHIYEENATLKGTNNT